MKKVRQQAVAGMFYPSDKFELDSMVDGFLDKAESPKSEGNIRALIVPHAGYEYSGQVAAYGYKAIGLSTSSRPIKTVVLIGNSHQEYFDGISVWNLGYFETPLGKIEIDEDFADKLIKLNNKIYFKESAHLQEHSLEVQLPFLQKVLASDWKLVPIILGNQGGTDILINALKDLIDENTLVIASSDLSHYPNYKDAQYSDNKVIEAILNGERSILQETISDLEKENIFNLQTCACGQDAIEVVMGLMQGKSAKLLKYANSGDPSRPSPRFGEAGEGADKSRVVGYASIVFTDSKLLKIARQAVETYIKQGKIIKIEESDSALNQHQGAFVTLNKNGQLRGCIGTFESNKPLYQTVIEMAISAAVNDPRFNPVSEGELDKLEYEISVLSPLKKVDSWEEIEIGKHGVQIKQGSRSGVFLPQVATENNWDRETFLSILCSQKAGLPSDCYKNKDTEIWVFTAQVFGEK